MAEGSGTLDQGWGDEGWEAMSFSDRPSLTWPQKLGCMVYFLAVTLMVANFALWSLAPDSDTPQLPIWERILVFIGPPLVAVIGGLVLIQFFMRDKN